MNIRRAALLLLALAALAPVPASAQSLGIRGYATFGVAQLAAKDSFEAVADLSQQPVFGGGVQVTNIWKGVFADVGVAQIQTIDGERVFIEDGEDDVLEVNIPLEVKMRPVDIAAGWRMTFGRISPYVGAGMTFFKYEETAEGNDPDENVDESKSGPLFLGGLDVAILSWLHAGGEIRYRQVTDILNLGGVSAEFGEDNAGGLTLAVRVSVGR
jgi:opacity protein-like surface antigen